MVQRTLPSTVASTGRQDADWQPVGLVSGPEGVQYGGGVTYIGARQIRLLPLMGKFGGFFWGTDQPVTVESTVNTSGNNRIDRLVMQYESGVGNTLAILIGAAATNPVVPSITQKLITDGNGKWQVPLAHWTVGRNGGPVSDLVYECSYPIRQEVPVTGESGGVLGGGATLLLSEFGITPFQPRCEIECETAVYIKALDGAAGKITLNGGGKARSEEFRAGAAEESVTVKLTHSFYSDTSSKPAGDPGRVGLNIVATAELNSGQFVIGRISSVIRERAV